MIHLVQLRELLDQERKKMLADREKESTAKVKSKVDVEKKKREVFKCSMWSNLIFFYAWVFEQINW